jgi:electron transfer flavoprotein beta subunit
MDKAHYGLAGSPTHVKKSFTPPVKQGGMVIKEETGAESAAKLAQILVDNNII